MSFRGTAAGRQRGRILSARASSATPAKGIILRPKLACIWSANPNARNGGHSSRSTLACIITIVGNISLTWLIGTLSWVKTCSSDEAEVKKLKSQSTLIRLVDNLNAEGAEVPAEGRKITSASPAITSASSALKLLSTNRISNSQSSREAPRKNLQDRKSTRLNSSHITIS